jgi:hypothetical protein
MKIVIEHRFNILKCVIDYIVVLNIVRLTRFPME